MLVLLSGLVFGFVENSSVLVLLIIQVCWLCLVVVCVCGSI